MRIRRCPVQNVKLVNVTRINFWREKKEKKEKKKKKDKPVMAVACDQWTQKKLKQSEQKKLGREKS